MPLPAPTSRTMSPGAHHRLDRPPERAGAHPVADHRPVYLELRVHRVRRVPDRRPHASIVAPAGRLAFSPTSMLARRARCSPRAGAVDDGGCNAQAVGNAGGTTASCVDPGGGEM